MRSQRVQVPLQAESQQTPSAHKPLPQSEALQHDLPLAVLPAGLGTHAVIVASVVAPSRLMAMSIPASPPEPPSRPPVPPSWFGGFGLELLQAASDKPRASQHPSTRTRLDFIASPPGRSPIVVSRFAVSRFAVPLRARFPVRARERPRTETSHAGPEVRALNEPRVRRARFTVPLAIPVTDSPP